MVFSLSPQDRQELRLLQKKNRDKKIFVRVTVLLMLDGGFSREDTAFALGIDPSTVSRYKERYASSGNLGEYLSDNYVEYRGKLTEGEQRALAEEPGAYLYLDTREVVAFIRQKFNKVYTTTGVVPLLHRLGFSYKKTKQEPCKADHNVQEEFLDGMLETLAGLAGDEAAYYMDGVHPQHNTKGEYGWIRTGQDFAVPANTGRKRLNINGALNAHDVTDVVIDEAGSVNAQSTVRLLEKIGKRNGDKCRIYIYSDNARYYHSRLLKAYLAENPRFVLLHLPPYSPNLNLIERLWKFLRKKVINSYYHEKFDDFRHSVLGFFKNIKNYRAELESLLTLKFQLFGK
jgi:transposase